MWSGPRNLSTAMMRSFGNRADCAAVIDEPFYAAFLAASGKQHPMRAEVLAAQPQDWRAVARACASGEVAAGRILYQKQMTHHMLPEFGLDWMDVVDHAFLIRAPERVVASYAARREEVAVEDLGFGRQAELFDRVAQRLGKAPPVVDAEAVRADPAGVLRRLCGALGLGFDQGMLAWPAGAAGERRGLGGALVCGGGRVRPGSRRRSRSRRRWAGGCAASRRRRGGITSGYGAMRFEAGNRLVQGVGIASLTGCNRCRFPVGFL